jgi:hypothetical protein
MIPPNINLFFNKTDSNENKEEKKSIHEIIEESKKQKKENPTKNETQVLSFQKDLNNVLNSKKTPKLIPLTVTG